MVDNHGFKLGEVELINLHRRTEKAQMRMFIYLLGALVSLMLAVVLVPRWAESAWVLVVSLVLLMAFAYCLKKLPRLKESERKLAGQQRTAYLVMRRQKWREEHSSLAVPEWQVLDRWEGRKHLYALMHLDDYREEWEDPLEPPKVHPRKRKKS